ncbi:MULTISPECIES: cytochrome c [unclassified Hydrotalea]|uniref:c-type cytochrome n=1 Tax=unclassified Hydrotalea TaxID=2643788 RepID=UPI001C52EE49|nr:MULTISPECIES: cytochrome c [unclassified Hydrotalea]
MKNRKPLYTITLALVIVFAITGILSINGCAPTKAVAAKSGAQLWAENCQRCHNTPSPVSFSAEQWETIGMHMQTRALITQTEREKIVAFLKSSR